MRSVTEDTYMMQTLELLQSLNMEVYINIKRNAQAALRMNLATAAEQAFYDGILHQYECYCLQPQDICLFLEYCSLPPTADMPYLYVRSDRLFAAIYFVNSSGIVTCRKHYYRSSNIKDLLCCFEESLLPCCPMAAGAAYQLKIS